MTKTIVQRFKSLLHNKSILALALILAIICWYGIREVTSFEKLIKDVPVRVTLEEGWSILERSASHTDVLFRGSREDISYLSGDHVEVVVNLGGNLFEGTKEIKLSTRHVKAPPRILPVSLRPDTFEISLDRESTKTVPVRLNLTGTLPEGLEIDDHEIRPATVLLSGPSERLKNVESVRTAAISLEGRFESFNARLALMQPGSDWAASTTPEEVEVRLQISERSVHHYLDGVPVRVLTEPQQSYRIHVQPAVVRAYIHGHPERLEAIQPEDIILHVRAFGLEPDTRFVLPVEAGAQRQCRVIDIDPPTVTVWVEEE